MQKNIGKSLALYPTPLVVVGTMVNNAPNYVLVGHLGIMGHDHIMLSLAKPHYTNMGIRENRTLTVNLVSQDMLAKADYAGSVSGHQTDKSQVFAYQILKTGAPVIEESPVVMECQVEDIYETKGFDNFICTIVATYVDESVLNDQNKIDYAKLKPVLFEMPTYQYLSTGDILGKCLKLKK